MDAECTVGSVEEAAVDEDARAVSDLFTRLEGQAHRTAEGIGMRSQNTRGTDERSRMRIMSACMHFSRNGRHVFASVRFLNRKRVDVCSEHYRLFTRLRSPDFGIHTRFADSLMRDADGVEFVFDLFCGIEFFPCDFRMHVEVPPQTDDIPMIVLYFSRQVLFDFIHTRILFTNGLQRRLFLPSLLPYSHRSYRMQMPENTILCTSKEYIRQPSAIDRLSQSSHRARCLYLSCGRR